MLSTQLFFSKNMLLFFSRQNILDFFLRFPSENMFCRNFKENVIWDFLRLKIHHLWFAGLSILCDKQCPKVASGIDSNVLHQWSITWWFSYILHIFLQNLKIWQYWQKTWKSYILKLLIFLESLISSNFNQL